MKLRLRRLADSEAIDSVQLKSWQSVIYSPSLKPGARQERVLVTFVDLAPESGEVEVDLV